MRRGYRSSMVRLSTPSAISTGTGLMPAQYAASKASSKCISIPLGALLRSLRRRAQHLGQRVEGVGVDDVGHLDPVLGAGGEEPGHGVALVAGDHSHQAPEAGQRPRVQVLGFVHNQHYRAARLAHQVARAIPAAWG